MSRYILSDAKTPIAKILSMPTTDSRVTDYINEAQERLLHKGKWPGTYAKYKVTASDGEITWPRQLETIETVAVDEKPGYVRGQWYEFLESGPGIRDSADGDARTLLDRGEAALFSVISGTNKKIRLATAVSGDAGLKVILQGFDETGAWIRTSIDGTYADGEEVTLTSTYVETTNKFSELSAAQKPVTAGNLTVNERDTDADIDREVGVWEPSETRPRYRRSLIAGLSTTNTAAVLVMGKLRYIPATVDTDWLLIPSVPALKLMVQAIRKEENNLIQEAVAYEQRALDVLNALLAHHIGDGAMPIPNVQATAFGGGEVANLQ